MTLIKIDPVSPVISRIILNRPERRNALSLELMLGLQAAFEDLEFSGQRAVILQGAGAVFCSGLDLVEAADPARAEESAQCVARLFETVLCSSLITVAAAEGVAFAGGAGLLACCDFVVASQTLQIGFPEVRRGLIPALVSVLLSGRIPESKLRELFLSAEPVSADAALAMGLANRIAPPDSILSEATRMAETVLQGAPEAVRVTKRHLRDLRWPGLKAQLQAALAAHVHARRGWEAREGIAAFLERRAPHWS